MAAADGEPRATRVGDEARILVVDGSSDVRESLRRILARDGYDAVVVPSAEEALQRLDQESFDVVVSEIDLPTSSGTDLLRDIRDTGRTLPVILSARDPDVQTAITAVELQAFYYLTKPYRARELLVIVGRAVAHRRMADVRDRAQQLTSDSAGTGPSLHDRFERAIETMWFAYQPIIDSNWSIVGFEAFLRCEEQELRGPLDFLSAAEQLGRVDELASKIRDQAPAPLLSRTEFLFMNIDPSQLKGDFLVNEGALARLGSRVVIEITDRAELQEIPDFEEKVWSLKEAGFRIAVDDLGAGYSGLTTFAQLEPEFVKLDGALIRGVQRDERKKMIIRSMAGLCLDLGISVVAEGVETQEEFEVLRELGCTHFQGFFVGRPAPLD